MRTCYCRKCGTPNSIEEGDAVYYCTNCGTQNQVPQAKNTAADTTATAAPEQPQAAEYKMPEQSSSYTSAYQSQPSYTAPQYGYNGYAGTTEQPVAEQPKKKKKTGLVVALVLIVAVIAAAVVLLITPVKSPLPIKFRCDECGKIKFSEKYEVEDQIEDKTYTEFICDDCFDELGFEEQ